MKYKIFLVVKSMIITVFMLGFISALFIVFNEGKKRIDGEGVFVYLTKNALYLKKGAKEIRIEPNKKKIERAINFSYEHPFILPFPFNFFIFSDCLLKNFF